MSLSASSRVFARRQGSWLAPSTTSRERWVKVSKHGSPDPQVLAKEIQDVLRAALALARHYNVEDRLRVSIDESYRKLLAEGYIASPNE